MRIRAKLQLSTLTALVFGIFVLLAILLTNNKVNRLIAESTAYNRLVQNVFGLDKIIDDLLAYPDNPRAGQQWHMVYGSLGDLLREIETRHDNNFLSIKLLIEKYERLDPLLAQLSATQAPTEISRMQGERKEILADQLSMTLASMITHASGALEINREKIVAAQQRAGNITVLLTIALIVTNAILFSSTSKKINKSLLELHEGTRIMGEGNLLHSMNLSSRDEFGELGKAFNWMAARLNSSYAALEVEIAERKRAEHALRESRHWYARAEQVAHFGHWNWYLLTREMDWSEETYRIFGVSAEEFQPTLENILRLVHPEDRHAVNSSVRAAISRREAFDIEFRIARKDRRWRHIHVVAEFRPDEDGQTTGLFGTVHDITEQREAEEETKVYMDKLEKSNQALQDFAFIASHDMREPLRKVISFGAMLKQKYGENLGQTGLDYLSRMLDSTRRMQSLLTSLLEYSQVSTVLDPFREVDLSNLIREVFSDLEVRIEKAEGIVQVGELPVINADPTQMRQLFQNLISNALKFHKEGEKPLVKVQCSAVDDRFCQITVEDNGIGFEQQYADRIFAPFQRLHGRSSQYEGAGMGLAICKKIIERHGGNIYAKSEPDKGSVFLIELPAGQTDGAKDGRTSLSKS
ncbi:MAG: ATP-binding protein [Syntrophobacteraceae bacterium]